MRDELFNRSTDLAGPLAKHSDEVASLLTEFETSPELSIDAATRADRALTAVADRHRKRADEDAARQKQRELKAAERARVDKALLELEETENDDPVPVAEGTEPILEDAQPIEHDENDPRELDDAAPVEHEDDDVEAETEMPYLASQRDGKPAVKRARADDPDMRQKRCKVRQRTQHDILTLQAFIIASNADTGYRVDCELVFRPTAREACVKFAEAAKTVRSPARVTCADDVAQQRAQSVRRDLARD